MHSTKPGRRMLSYDERRALRLLISERRRELAPYTDRDSGVARRVDRRAAGGPLEWLANRLSLREREVLNWAARGLRNSEIAAVLEMERSTVSCHMTRAVHKLGFDEREQAVRFVLEEMLGLNTQQKVA